MTHPPIEAKGQTGTITFDGTLITIRRTGFVARMIVGKGTKEFRLANLAAVQFKPAGPIISGYIAFTLPGGVEVKSRPGRATYDAANDENSVMFTQKQMPAFTALRDAVQAALREL